MLKKYFQMSRIRPSPVPTHNRVFFCEQITKNVFVSDHSTFVVLALYHSQAGICAYMLYALFLFHVSACILLGSVLFC